MKALYAALCAACGWTGRTDKPPKDARGNRAAYRCPKCGGDKTVTTSET